MSLRMQLISFIACIAWCNAQFTTSSIKLPVPISGHAAGVYNNQFTIINGYDTYNTNPINGSYSISLYPIHNTNWILHSFSMPLGVSEIYSLGSISVQNDNLVYIINPVTVGGTATSLHVMFIYDLSLNQYQSSSISPPLHYVGKPCVVYNKNSDMIYSIGGYTDYSEPNDGRQSYTQRYDVANNIWDKVGEINLARLDAGCSMDISNENIYLFAGRIEDKISKTIEKYSVVDDKWIVLSETLTQSRFGIICKLFPNNAKIYCMGGIDHSQKPYDLVDIFNPLNYSVTTTTLNVKRRDLAATLWDNDCMIISGGVIVWGSGHLATDSIEYLGHCTFSSQSESITPQPTTSIPSEYEGQYVYLYDALCDNLDAKFEIMYDVTSVSECVEYCHENADSCTMINYFNYFKGDDDARCYLFRAICDIKMDNNANRSVIGYRVFDSECLDYPVDWSDSVGDSCTYYKTSNWCDTRSLSHDENAFYSLIDSKYGLSAIESCCECDGGINIVDNVAFSHDYIWTTSEDYICDFTARDMVQSVYRTWDNLVLYHVCTNLMHVASCAFLIDTEFVAKDDSAYTVFMCMNVAPDYVVHTYDFILEFFEIEEERYGIYINTLWFHIDISYYSESVRLRVMNYTECESNILSMHTIYNESQFKISGIHPCYLLDTYSPTTQPTNAPLDSSSIVGITAAVICFICAILGILWYFDRKKKLESEKQTNKQKQMEMFAMDSQTKNTAPSAPTLDSDNERDEMNNEDVVVSQVNECIICCDRSANMFNYPCGHVTYCDKCSDKALKQSSKCPNCRVEIECKRIYQAGFT
eukprot:186026_1